MKSYKQFCTESYSARENIQEALPLAVAAGLKLGSMALGAYSGYRAAQELKKGNYGRAAVNALGMLPAGGQAFKAVQALGRGRNLARGASAATSAARWSGARNEPIDAAVSGAVNAGGSAIDKLSKSAKKTGIKPAY